MDKYFCEGNALVKRCVDVEGFGEPAGLGVREQREVAVCEYGRSLGSVVSV